MAEEQGGGQEKTEEATPRKLQEARERGETPRSQELPSAFILFVSAFVLFGLGPGLALDVVRFQAEILHLMALSPSGMDDAMFVLSRFGWTLARAVGPLLLALAVASLLVGLAQGRGAFSTEVLQPKMSHLDPIAGLKRIFGIRAVINFLKQLLKFVLVGVVSYLTIRAAWPDLLGLMGSAPPASAEAIHRLTLRLLGFTAAAYFLLAIGDFGFEYWEHAKKMRMTPQEVKEEIKKTDGDPFLKARIREQVFRRSRGRMLEDIPTAAVVIVNPTHRAVALRYQPERDLAPVVVAMGERKLALKIREIAETHHIPIREDRTLAKALIKTATVGEPIPGMLYLAVAEILGSVYRARGLSPRSPRRPL